MSGITGFLLTGALFVVFRSLGAKALILRLRAKSLRTYMRYSTPVKISEAKAPVLYLRSFRDDYAHASQRSTWGDWWGGFGLGSLESLDELVTQELERYGPVVAAGFPDESLPVPGAMRITLPAENWQDAIDQSIAKARMIVVVPALTSGLKWEIASYDNVP
jgi:hypothetical protein